MKIKRIYLFLILPIILLLISTKVFAAEGDETITKADFTNSNFQLVKDRNFYGLEVSNITLPNKADGEPVNVNIIYTIGNTEPDFSLQYKESRSGSYNAETKKIVFPNAETILQLKGDAYFWIYQLDDTKVNGTLVYSNKLERPEDKRYGDIFDEDTSVNASITRFYINAPMQNWLNRKAQFRIGEITDNSILLAIKNNDTENGYKKLLEYGKTSASIYEEVLEGSPNFTASLKLQDSIKSNKYYFIYVKFDDENGKYNPIEGITVAQSVKNETSWTLVLNRETKFNWNDLEEPDVPPVTPDDTNKEDEDNNTKPEKPTDQNKNENINNTTNEKENENENINNNINETKKENVDKTVSPTPIPKAGKDIIIFGLVIVLSITSMILYCLNKKYSFIK